MMAKKIRMVLISVISFVLGAVLLFTLSPNLFGKMLTVAQSGKKDVKEELWYDEPASEGTLLSFPSTGVNVSSEFDRWQQTTLPLGNGAFGATVYGEVGREHIVVNEKTLWNGGPSDSRPNYNGGNKAGVVYNGMTMAELYKEIQRLFLAGETANASKLCDKLIGEGSSGGYGAYQTWGDIYLNTGISDYTDYRRSLDLETGVAFVSFKSGGAKYEREYFVSYPDNVFVMRFASDKEMSVGVEFLSDQGASPSVQNGVLTLAGSLKDNGMLFHSEIRVAAGVAVSADGVLTVTGKEIVLVAAAATDYKNDYPSYRTGESEQELAARVSSTAKNAVEKGYDELLREHERDYTSLYSRFTLDLGQSQPNSPTDELLADYKSGTATEGEERYLEVLLYQFGRYLTIASSREGNALPSNLQGLWNPVNNPPWSGDYHMNVNLQMNYWPTYASNLAECALPLIEYVDGLREPGRVTAEIYTGVKSGEGEENGFTAHTQNTPFGWTCPGWQFSWGWSPAAVPWILQNVYEYYEYTKDTQFLEERIYPMLREETVYFEQILIEDPATGRKLTAPAYSPEHGPRTMGNTYEQSLIWQLFEDTIEAAGILGKDLDNVGAWRDTQAALKPIEIGDSGQIKEWYDETTLGRNENGTISGYQNDHRHMSHLLGLFPGDLINADDNAENGWLDAAVVSLKNRGDKSTGWAMGQRINAWARTGDGDHAYKLIRELFANGIYSNLFDAHPPFQIDGNFGYTSGVNEMLMQSNLGYINLLAALPSEWSEGCVEGMVARGNFELDFSWKNSTLSGVKILSRAGGECTLQYPEISSAKITLQDGTPVDFTVLGDDKISFDTEIGEVILIEEIPVTLAQVGGTEAYHVQDGEVYLRWNEVAGAESYVVCRRTGDGAWKTIGTTSETNYTDASFKTADFDGLHWAVYARNGTAESAEITAFDTPEDLRNDVGFLNDDHAVFRYSSGWKSEKQTISFNGDVHYALNGATVSFSFYGDGFIAYARKHAVFELCDVTVDGVKVKAGVSGYNGSDLGQAELVSVKGIDYGFHEVTLEFYADTANPNRKRVDFDGIAILRERPAYTASFEGPETESIKGNGEIVLPTAKKEGKAFVGWLSEGKLYAPESKYELVKNTVFRAVFVDFRLADGVSIRFDKAGIRWSAFVSETDYRKFAEFGAVYGMTLSSDNPALSGERFVETKIWYENSATEGYRQYNTVLVDISEPYYATKFTAKGTIRITYADGETREIYSVNEVTRSISEIAAKALEDTRSAADEKYKYKTETGEYSPYSDEERLRLQEFVK